MQHSTLHIFRIQEDLYRISLEKGGPGTHLPQCDRVIDFYDPSCFLHLLDDLLHEFLHKGGLGPHIYAYPLLKLDDLIFHTLGAIGLMRNIAHN